MALPQYVRVSLLHLKPKVPKEPKHANKLVPSLTFNGNFCRIFECVSSIGNAFHKKLIVVRVGRRLINTWLIQKDEKGNMFWFSLLYNLSLLQNNWMLFSHGYLNQLDSIYKRLFNFSLLFSFFVFDA